METLNSLYDEHFSLNVFKTRLGVKATAGKEEIGRKLQGVQQMNAVGKWLCAQLRTPDDNKKKGRAEGSISTGAVRKGCTLLPEASLLMLLFLPLRFEDS